MDYILGILTGVVISSWIWWEAMKAQYREYHTIERDLANEEKRHAEEAIRQLMEETKSES